MSDDGHCICISCPSNVDVESQKAGDVADKVCKYGYTIQDPNYRCTSTTQCEGRKRKAISIQAKSAKECRSSCYQNSDCVFETFFTCDSKGGDDGGNDGGGMNGGAIAGIVVASLLLVFVIVLALRGVAKAAKTSPE